MAKRASLAASTALASLLTACTGTPVISYTNTDSYYTGALSYAAARGGMPTEVVGNPFDVPKADLDRRVTETFEANHFGPELPFLTQVPEGYSPSYRVILLFNPAPYANAMHLCASTERPQAKPLSREVGVLAAFCSSGTRITSAFGRLSGVRGLDDPAFERLLAQLSLVLFPPQQERRGDDRNRGIRKKI